MTLSEIRKLRPWYLVVAMALTSLFGVTAASTACSTFSHLRGDHQVLDNLNDQLKGSPHAVVRPALVGEQARLRAVGQNHRVTFPLSIARLLLALLLTFFSGTALAGRRNSRRITMQIVLANAILALVAFQVLTPVRVAMIDAVAKDAVAHADTLKSWGEATDAASIRQLNYWMHRLRFGVFELGTLLAALIALSRPRTRAFFAAMRAFEQEAASQDPPAGDR